MLWQMINVVCMCFGHGWVTCGTKDKCCGREDRCCDDVAKSINGGGVGMGARCGREDKNECCGRW